MRFVIVTGMSGAGKSSVLKMLEDDGYFCADNLPAPLIGRFAYMFCQDDDGGDNNITKVAIGIDVRNRNHLKVLESVLEEMKSQSIDYEILFMDSRNDTLVKRYKETRRRHPLDTFGRLEDAIEEERREMAFLRGKADYIIDTSNLLVRDLKREIDHIFVENGSYNSFFITLLSFGFKYGIPSDADLVFDVRFLPNPYYVDELKHLTGNDSPVYNYVMESKDSEIFLEQIRDLMLFLIPRYIAEGKNQLVVAIGCTGGKHRSVTMTNALSKALADSGYRMKAAHRDIDRDRPAR